MKNIRSHFVFNRSQQNGIFLLVVIIVILQLVYLFVDFSEETDHYNPEQRELVEFQKKIDSIKQASTSKDSVRLFPFNPNFITDYKGYTLGMSPAEIDRLHQHRAQDKWVNSSVEFQKVTGVSDSLLQVISPYFQFPVWANTGKASSRGNLDFVETKDPGMKKDLNSASKEELMEVKGIGEVLASRIVNYRIKIGNFVDDIQLKDIYGLNYEVRQEVLSAFTVKTPARVTVININEASVLELTEIPYISYELAREIVNYRLLHEGISSFEELAKIKDFPSEKIDRIALYLTLK